MDSMDMDSRPFWSTLACFCPTILAYVDIKNEPTPSGNTIILNIWLQTYNNNCNWAFMTYIADLDAYKVYLEDEKVSDNYNDTY